MSFLQGSCLILALSGLGVWSIFSVATWWVNREHGDPTHPGTKAVALILPALLILGALGVFG